MDLLGIIDDALVDHKCKQIIRYPQPSPAVNNRKPTSVCNRYPAQCPRRDDSRTFGGKPDENRLRKVAWVVRRDEGKQARRIQGRSARGKQELKATIFRRARSPTAAIAQRRYLTNENYRASRPFQKTSHDMNECDKVTSNRPRA